MYYVGALCVGKGANASQHENYVEKLYHTASGFLCAGARCDAGHHSPRSLHWQVAVDDDNKETGAEGTTAVVDCAKSGIGDGTGLTPLRTNNKSKG